MREETKTWSKPRCFTPTRKTFLLYFGIVFSVDKLSQHGTSFSAVEETIDCFKKKNWEEWEKEKE